MKRKVYLETSVISYLAARPSKNVIEAGHQQSTYQFWDRRDEFDLFASELVLTECAAGDPEAATKRLAALRGIKLLDITSYSIELAKDLVIAGIVPAKASEDALHISIATVHFSDYLLTWNCRHIANPEIQARIAENFRGKGHTLTHNLFSIYFLHMFDAPD
ncbi:type II toxin-antitoxin system VapC family toxin, partial [Candidatus Accumulibacter aalborgensis]|uniref:type II toxin-antitoxin system VapC family toxin n=1 Tax=Candidatus Accumulibacter aalborgensis TaxID=1860102 RepID=UPI000A7B4507